MAWHNLFEDANLRVTADELKLMNKTSVALADGGGYMANLGQYETALPTKMY
jgi:hypothetical protein